jgi:hypothetical protein
MSKKKQGGQSLTVTQAIKPIGIAKELLPPGTDKTVVRALADKIINRNDLKRGEAIKPKTTVNVGKAQTTLSKYLPNNKTVFALKDPSLENRFVGLGKIQAEPLDPIVDGGGGGGSSVATPVPTPVKTAPIDTVEFVDESLSAELMLDLLFEDVGGQELLTIARNDTVNGQSVIYQPFKNLGILQEIYSPENLVRLSETSDKIFSNFIIDLSEKIPIVGNGPNGANYYLDMATGDGVIELVNLRSDEQVEIQIGTAGIIEDIGI